MFSDLNEQEDIFQDINNDCSPNNEYLMNKDTHQMFADWNELEGIFQNINNDCW